MRAMTLGPDGPRVAALGSGDVSLARSADRGIDRREVEAALCSALELGIDVIEIAAESDAERVVGDAIRTMRARDRAIAMCRIPALREIEGLPSRALPPAGYVQECVEASLRATKLEALPLVALGLRSTWRTQSPFPELVGTCHRLIAEGKVMRWAAVPFADDPEHAAIVAEPWLSAIALIWNLCSRAGDAIIAAAFERKLAVLARAPLAGGALAGDLGPGRRFPPRDDRADLDLEPLAIAAAKLAALVKREPPAARSSDGASAALERALKIRPASLECTTVAELALRWVIDRGAIPLPRLHRREHIPEAVGALAAAPLSSDLMKRLDEFAT
jgi:aryl-alcohol dehydrogenase-like predicted oxidoreductase